MTSAVCFVFAEPSSGLAKACGGKRARERDGRRLHVPTRALLSPIRATYRIGWWWKGTSEWLKCNVAGRWKLGPVAEGMNVMVEQASFCYGQGFQKVSATVLSGSVEGAGR